MLSGTLVLLALSFLTSTFKFIPKTTLAAVIVTAMIYMLEYHAILMLWRTKKADLIPLFTTFVFSLLLGLEFGIIVGIAVNLVFILYSTARPSVSLNWIPVGLILKFSSMVRIGTILEFLALRIIHNFIFELLIYSNQAFWTILKSNKIHDLNKKNSSQDFFFQLDFTVPNLYSSK